MANEVKIVSTNLLSKLGTKFSEKGGTKHILKNILDYMSATQRPAAVTLSHDV